MKMCMRMRMMRPTVIVFNMLVAFALAGCGQTSPIEDIVEGRKVEYERSEYQDRKELQYPPDIISTIEKEQAESQLLSEYSIAAIPDISTAEEVELSGERKVTYRRQGNVRWIDLDLSPGESWELAKQFWDTIGFNLSEESPATGTMETNWLDLRQTPSASGLGSILDGFIKQVRDSGERDKFVTRVEALGEDGSSLFIAHRHVAAKTNDDGIFSGYEPLPPEAQIESEMLRRFMIFASKTPEALQEEEFIEEIAAVEEAASEEYQLDGTRLLIQKPLEESWVLVRIGLDRGGFTIDDQDYGERTYFIEHTGGPESQKIFGEPSTGLFARLFGDDGPVLRKIKLMLSYEDDVSVVRAEAGDDGEPLTEEQSSVLLELLHDNLP